MPSAAEYDIPDLIPMRTTNVLRWFLGLAIGLPILIVLLLFAGALLRSMNDETGAEVLRGIAVGGGVLWAIVLVGLLIAVAVDLIGRER